MLHNTIRLGFLKALFTSLYSFQYIQVKIVNQECMFEWVWSEHIWELDICQISKHVLQEVCLQEIIKQVWE